MIASSTPAPTRSCSRTWLLLMMGLIAGAIGTTLGVILIGMPFALGHRNDLPLERIYVSAFLFLAL